MRAIWKRELKSYFETPVGYIFLGIFLLISSVLFYGSILRQHSGDLPTFLGQMSYLWMLLSPVLTMRLLAEERQKGTDQLLRTSPVSLVGIVSGKYLAAVTLLGITAGITLIYAGVVAAYGQVFPAELAVNYLGFLLQGCAFAAMDLYLSGWAATPVTAAVLSFGANFLVWMMDLLKTQIPESRAESVLEFFSLYSRNEPFLMGQLSWAGIVYGISFVLVFLALTVFHLDRGQGKRRRIGALGLAGGIAALAALNVGLTRLEKQKGWRADYSFNGIASQSEITREALNSLTRDVHVYALFTKGQEDAPLMELLDRYAARSGHFTWEQADPSLNPGLVTSFSTETESVTSDSLIVYCPETGRWRVLSPAEFVSVSLDEETGTYTYAGYTYEQAITGAILHVTREELPRIVILQGHGELDGETLSAFEILMTENRYEVIWRDLASSEYTPEPGELLVFFSPLRDLSEPELKKVTDFTGQGGSVLFTCDYSDPVPEMPRYASLLRSYGFLPKEGIVVADREDPDSYYNNIRIDLIPEMKGTDVTAELIASGADTVLMPGTRAFETPKESDRNLMTLPVLVSGESAYLKQLSVEMTHLEREEGDETGPFSLALQARRVTEDGYISKAFISGSSALWTDGTVYSMTDARQLILRMTEYLTGQAKSDLDITPRNAVRPALSPRGNTAGAVAVTALPMSVFLIALAVLLKRRNQ